MTEYNSTVTTDARSQDYSNVKGHNNRITDEHSNKDIDVTKSYMNSGEELLDYQTLKEEHYGDHVKKVNKNRRGAKGKANSKYKDVNDYLRRTKGSADTTFVQWFGNKADWEVIQDDLVSKGLTEEDIKNALDEGYKSYAKGFNERNEYVKIQEWVSHQDEATPHYHGRMFTKGHSKTGKPSKTLNSALQLEYPNNTEGNRSRMREFRRIEDLAFFEELSKSLSDFAKSKNVDAKFNLYRKDEHNGLTMSGYKEKMKIEEQEVKEKERLTGVVNDIVKLEENLDSREVAIKEKEDELDEREVSLGRKEKKLDERSDELYLQEDNLDFLEDDLNEKIARQQRMIEQLSKERERDLKEKEDFRIKSRNYVEGLKKQKKRNEEYHKTMFNNNLNVVTKLEKLPITRAKKNEFIEVFMENAPLVIEINKDYKRDTMNNESKMKADEDELDF